MPHTHISRDDRKTIAALLLGGRHNLTEIAAHVGKSPSAVSREVGSRTDPDGTYRAGSADGAARGLRAAANGLRRKIVPGSEALRAVEDGLRKYWSPEQVVGRHRRERGAALVSPATVYAYVWRDGRELIPFLRHARKRLHRRRHGTKQREMRREESKKRRIDARPEVVEGRSRIGDWEGDTVVGQEKTEHVLTHVDRKSRFLAADRVRGTAESVLRATLRRFARYPRRKRLTGTYDNGVTFSAHEELEARTGMEIFFAYPYHSWERGTNENTNGLLRQFLPKGTFFAGVTQRKLDRFVRLINTRPRKCLDYRTPEEVFNCVSD